MSRKSTKDSGGKLDVLARIRELEKSIYDLRTHLRDTSEIEELSGTHMHLIVCGSGEAFVAFRLEVVDEVVPAALLAPIPEAPPWVSGVLTLRGVSMPVLDVQARVARVRRQIQVTDCILIGRVKGAPYGLIVQEIVDIPIVDTSMIQPPPMDLDVAPYVIGTVNAAGRVIHLLSASRLVAYSDIPDMA